MTYSIFDSTGNLVEAFADRRAAFDCIAGIANADTSSAGKVFLVAHDDKVTWWARPLVAAGMMPR